MLGHLVKTLFLLLLIVGGAVGLFFLEKNRSSEAQLRRENQRLQAEKEHLEKFVARLTSSRRVAEVMVTDQTLKNGTVDATTLMFVEYAPDGLRLPPKFFTFQGSGAHIDALVVKFDQSFMKNGDALRGQSLVLFYRIFGDHMTPAQGYRIDQPGRSPEFYRPDPAAPVEQQQFEAELWQNFWKLAEDPAYRAQMGVRVAQGESPWVRHYYPDRIYTVSLDAAGGLNITDRPIDGIWKEYRDAIKRQRPV